MSIRVIIADDERAAREELKVALQAFPDMELVGEARHVAEALELISVQPPDLLLLDIHMPGGSGFELLESLSEAPLVVFTTAFDQYAIRAFEVNALDYLLKPIRDERFAQAMQKVRERTGQKQPKQVFVKDGDTCHFIKLDELYLIESMDNYSRLYFGAKKAYQKRSLNQWEAQLDERFFRANRTQLVNLGHVKQVRALSQGRYQLLMHNGTEVEVSSRQSARLRSLGYLKNT